MDAAKPIASILRMTILKPICQLKEVEVMTWASITWKMGQLSLIMQANLSLIIAPRSATGVMLDLNSARPTVREWLGEGQRSPPATIHQILDHQPLPPTTTTFIHRPKT
ncbi:hypothetical protein L1049_020014 [Liquidambar formosana]|uniref:Uncharacterized protein n=1 Tax=Liquidambar formosana TaxID=63359 RepID=A0AAP0XAH3_LIQFO